MKNQFVTYEIAKKLKEIGYNENCASYYYEDKELSSLFDEFRVKNSKTADVHIAAPLWQQVIDWLREEHKLLLTVNPNYKKWIISRINDDIFKPSELMRAIHYESKDGFDYIRDREKAILTALNLI